MCDNGGVPAGFCWGCEKGGRVDDPKPVEELEGGLSSGGIENEVVAVVGADPLVPLDTDLPPKPLFCWKLELLVGVIDREPKPPMDVGSEEVAPNIVGGMGFTTGAVGLSDIGLVVIGGNEEV